MAGLRGWMGLQVSLGVLAMVVLSACGGKGGETDPAQPLPTDTVSGTATFKGAPLPGVQILLYSTNSNVFTQTAVTDVNGKYSFSGLGTSGDYPADWMIWPMSTQYGLYPSVSTGAPDAQVVRCGSNNFLLGYNTGGIGLDITGIHYDSLANGSMTGADFAAYDGSNPLATVARTGQTTSYAAGDDAGLQKGVAWPAIRFTDNQDGTVTDHLTGLLWLKNAGALAPANYLTALAEAHQLANGVSGLTDGSQAGDWRLPNVNELASLVDISASQPALTPGFPFTGVSNGVYWTSTPVGAGNEGTFFAWCIRMGDGAYNDDEVTNQMTTGINAVWAVKGAGGGAAPLIATGMDANYVPWDDGSTQTGIHFTYPRFRQNGDGTVTDTLTGLVWLYRADAINLPWAEAVAAVNGLASGQYGLTDGSVAGAWRMPTRNELQSICDHNQANNADFFDNTYYYADGSLYQAAVFTGFIPLQFYWTSSTYAPDPTQAWTVYSCDFGVYNQPKANSGYTVAVR